MGWADELIKQLQAGKAVSTRPKGRSMEGRIASGQLVDIIPAEQTTLDVDDIVLCRVKGNVYLHIIKAIDKDRYQIGNNKGFINGWIKREAIFGRCTAIHTVLDTRPV